MSTGSGIPEMKTILRGIRIPGYLNIKTFISKSVSPHTYSHVTIHTYHVTIIIYMYHVHIMCRLAWLLLWELVYPLAKRWDAPGIYTCTNALTGTCTIFFPSLYALYKNTYNCMVSMLLRDLDTQGPFVHLACIIANLMNKIITTVNTVFSVSESASVSRKWTLHFELYPLRMRPIITSCWQLHVLWVCPVILQLQSVVSASTRPWVNFIINSCIDRTLTCKCL